jgi:hypothetical protein
MTKLLVTKVLGTKGNRIQLETTIIVYGSHGHVVKVCWDKANIPCIKDWQAESLEVHEILSESLLQVPAPE